jgi:hypothetical protein
MNRCYRVLNSGSVPRFWRARIFLVFIVLAFLPGHSAKALTGSGDEPNSSDNQPKTPISAPRGPLPSGQAAGVIPAQGTYYIQDPLFWEEAGVLTLLAVGVAGILVGGRTSTTVTTSGASATSSH